jgi:hypothetical protein
LRHVEAVRHARFFNVVTDRRIEDRLFVLTRDNTAGRKGATITNRVDVKLDGFVRVTRAQKIGVQAMRFERRRNRLVGSHKALSDDLPAKNALLGEQTIAHKGIFIGLPWGDVL